MGHSCHGTSAERVGVTCQILVRSAMSCDDRASYPRPPRFYGISDHRSWVHGYAEDLPVGNLRNGPGDERNFSSPQLPRALRVEAKRLRWSAEGPNHESVPNLTLA